MTSITRRFPRSVSETSGRRLSISTAWDMASNNRVPGEPACNSLKVFSMASELAVKSINVAM